MHYIIYLYYFEAPFIETTTVEATGSQLISSLQILSFGAFGISGTS